jgi:hypothetical protein
VFTLIIWISQDICDKRDMTKEMWIVWYGFESLVGRFIMMEENWTKQNNIDEVFMLYQSMNRSLRWLIWTKSHKSSNSVTTLLLNKCDNNYS